ncbi:hypothetical protein [Jannaschia formosa]|uniref:hypothetical protein n=1 Tax=Jannaschia formosa TaxID=2259592 RepID=UPI000E1C33E0|nr:hypothetical protein [Jannaschia formosa]TFL16773.1 hypothetical protein DR046_17950 [Jannaschia formosa]
MTLALRPPAQVMRLERLGALHQTRLSFMRQLTRRMAAEGWRFARPVWRIGADGTGHAVLTATGPARTYSLVAFAHDLAPEARTDRVIAEAWDATFALFDGVPGEADIARLARNVPLQEAGRLDARCLTLSRANRSERAWDMVVSALASGRQPEAEALARVGYLMRTTAVYGSGKFGAADRESYAYRPELAAPFQAEMLTVYLIRAFVRDLAEHAARIRNPDAPRLDPALAETLGIGNSTGLGMAPFLVNHPGLLNNWIAARETAIARIRALPAAAPEARALFGDLLARARADLSRWTTAHPRQAPRVARLRRDLTWLSRQPDPLGGPAPWDMLCRRAEGLSPEACELVHSLILEPYPDLVDDLAATMSCPDDGQEPLEGAMPVATLRRLLRETHGDALDADWDAPEATARLWYVSEEKQEPRLAERADEPLEQWEQPLAPLRDAARLWRALSVLPDDRPAAHLLLDAPQHRAAIRRVQLAARAPYGEIRDNTLAAGMVPVDMLRANLSFFGATRFDPRSDRWLRICMFAGAPYPEALTEACADLWVYPSAP